MPLITRTAKGSKLTTQEMDDNLTYLESGSLHSIENPEIGDTLVWNGTDWVADSGLLYKEVEIPASEILTWTSLFNRKELLPQPDTGKYYEIPKMLIEYKPNGINYSGTFQFLAVSYSEKEYWLNALPMKDQYDTIWTLNMSKFDTVYNESNQPVVPAIYPNYTPVEILMRAGTIADGNGTLLVKIWYSIETFGSNL
jgi:hypothetical protein